MKKKNQKEFLSAPSKGAAAPWIPLAACAYVKLRASASGHPERAGRGSRWKRAGREDLMRSVERWDENTTDR